MYFGSYLTPTGLRTAFHHGTSIILGPEELLICVQEVAPFWLGPKPLTSCKRHFLRLFLFGQIRLLCSDTAPHIQVSPHNVSNGSSCKMAQHLRQPKFQLGGSDTRVGIYSFFMILTSSAPYFLCWPVPHFLVGTSLGFNLFAAFSSLLMAFVETQNLLAASFCITPASLMPKAHALSVSLMWAGVKKCKLRFRSLL